MDGITVALETLETTHRAAVTNALNAMSYAQLSGLYDALETARKHLEKLQSEVECEIGVREWEGVAA